MPVTGDRSERPTATDADTVVIGAGVAGLALARELVAAGRTVLVLEARERVGGRLRSIELAGGGRADLGATWFWPGERRVAALAADLGVRTHEQHLTGDAIYDAPGSSTRLEGNPIDVPSFRFTDGADSLTDALVARLPADAVRPSRRVHRVDTTGPAIVVHAGTDRFRSRTVALALPPPVAVSRIEFVPAFAGRFGEIARATPVWMGSMTKVVAAYDRPFWRDDGLAGSAISHVGPLREIHDMSGPGGDPAMLFGFAPGGGDVPPVAVIDQLVRLFGPGAAQPKELHVTDWAKDLSCSGEHASTAFELFGHPTSREAQFGGRVVCASTETGSVSPGHIEGALEAAEHAARLILPAFDHSAIPTRGVHP